MSDVNLGSVYATLELRTDQWDTAVKNIQGGMSGVGSTMKSSLANIGDGLKSVGGTMSTYVTAPVVVGFGLAVKSALSLEDQMADVRKTTNATSDEIKNIKEELLKMGSATRTSVDELAGIATIGGQIGIGSEDIVSFTGAIDKMNVALGDEFTGGAEEVTNAVGGLRQIFTDIRSDNVSDDLLKIGNALNVLGAEGLATAPVVSDFASRIGGATAVLGNTAGDILGMSATLQELQVTAERGGTAVGRVFQQMAADTDTFAKVVGVSGPEFKKMVDEDINGAFIRVLESVNNMNLSATDMATLLDNIGLSGAGNVEVFSKLSQNVGLLKEKQDLANNSLGETDSIMSEFNIKNETGQANLEKLRNKFVEIADKAAPTLLRTLESLASILEKVANWFNSLSDGQRETILVILGVLAVIGPLMTMMGGVITLVTTLSTVLTAIAAAVGISVGWIIVIIVALVIIVILVIRYWDEIKAATITAWNAVANFFKTWWDNLRVGFQNVISSIANFFKTWWDNLRVGFQNVISSIANFFVNSWNSIKNTAISMWTSIKDGIAGVINSLFGFITGSIGGAYDWGRNLIGNFVDGIKSVANKVSDAVKGVATKIKNLLGFGSPTKEGPGSTADEWIPNLMNMMIGQLNQFKPKMASALSGITGSMSLSAESSGGNSSSNSFQFFGPVNMRDENSIDLLAEMVASKMSGAYSSAKGGRL